MLIREVNGSLKNNFIKAKWAGDSMISSVHDKTKEKILTSATTMLLLAVAVPIMIFVSFTPVAFADVDSKTTDFSVPSEFESDHQMKFDEGKWRKLTDQGLQALEHKQYKSAESCFQAAVREASKASSMSTFMIDSLVHTAEVYRLTGRKSEAKDTFDQALQLVGCLIPEKCPLCGSEKDSVPVIYGPHSDELDQWVKSKAAQLGDFAEVTKKGRKYRPEWYCKTCEKSY